MMLFIFCLGALFATVANYLFFRQKKGSFDALARMLLEQAEKEIDFKKASFELELKEKYLQHEKMQGTLTKEKYDLIAKREEKLIIREEKMEQRLSFLEKKLHDFDKKEESIKVREDKLLEEKNQLLEGKALLAKNLEHLATLDRNEAKQLLFEQLENELHNECNSMITNKLEAAKVQADEEAKRILLLALQRAPIPHLVSSTFLTVFLPNDEIKRRIIGREGRNIRTLEQITGVQYLLDETPQAVVISGCDPIRKHVAKTALTELIRDGRIHPTRIEEAVSAAEQQIQQEMLVQADLAMEQTKVQGIRQDLKKYLGKLYFMSDRGSMLLLHSIHVSLLMGCMAAELGLDEHLARRIGLLHDVGKAVSAEALGSHALIGFDLALKYGEDEKIANGIGSHHNEISPTTKEAFLCPLANTLSRTLKAENMESIESTFFRMKKIEAIASSFDGVEKAFALQAGPEVRVIVEPELFDDARMMQLARSIAQQITHDIRFSGKIKVCVIRESKAIEYAS